jgi:hypothetical protein
VPILPLIDLLILLATGSLLVGFVLKAIAITTQYRPTLLGFNALDLVIVAGVFLGLVLVLSARMWVKVNEPRFLASRRRADLRQLRAEEDEAAAREASGREAR